MKRRPALALLVLSLVLILGGALSAPSRVVAGTSVFLNWYTAESLGIRVTERQASVADLVRTGGGIVGLGLCRDEAHVAIHAPKITVVLIADDRIGEAPVELRTQQSESDYCTSGESPTYTLLAE